MRLNVSRAAAEEQLLRLVEQGFQLVLEIEGDWHEKTAAGIFDELAELEAAKAKIGEWSDVVVKALEEIFPTKRESFRFLYPDIPMQPVQDSHYKFRAWLSQTIPLVKGLDRIVTALSDYTDLPIGSRLYVEDIDSFARVRDVNHATVANVLHDGRIELAEDEVQLALEQILDVSFHRRAWGGEINDLYTANVIINGRRTSTAFALKGKGCRARELTIADCGKNGDQLVRLLDSPASLFVVQYVGAVSDAVVRDIEGKVEQRRNLGKPAWYCVIDGQDTARLLKAYGKLADIVSAPTGK